jgi:hypothetical protein
VTCGSAIQIVSGQVMIVVNDIASSFAQRTDAFTVSVEAVTFD